MSDNENLVFGDMNIEASTASALNLTPAYGFNSIGVNDYEPPANIADECEPDKGENFIGRFVVCSSNNQEGEVIGTCGEFAWVKFEGHDAPETRHVSLLSKPKSPVDEWPCVGDEVLIRIDAHEWDVKYGHDVDGLIGIVRSVFKDGDVTVYAISVDGVCYCFVRGLLQKPKAPEEELRDEIYSIIQNNDYGPAVEAIIEKYNITKKDK